MGIFSSSSASRDAVVQLSLDCRALPDFSLEQLLETGLGHL